MRSYLAVATTGMPRHQRGGMITEVIPAALHAFGADQVVLKLREANRE
jgi:hypothetical protein